LTERLSEYFSVEEKSNLLVWKIEKILVELWNVADDQALYESNLNVLESFLIERLIIINIISLIKNLISKTKTVILCINLCFP
jgi:hypothetical protein